MTGISIKYHFDGECAGKVMTGISIKYHFDGECAGKVMTGNSIKYHFDGDEECAGTFSQSDDRESPSNTTLMENVPAK